MEVKEFKSVISGKTYKLKPLTFGESCTITDEATEIDEKTLLLKPSTKKLKVLRIQKMLVEPEMTAEEIADLPEAEGYELDIATRSLNTLPLAESPSQSLHIKEQKQRVKESSE